MNQSMLDFLKRGTLVLLGTGMAFHWRVDQIRRLRLSESRQDCRL